MLRKEKVFDFIIVVYRGSLKKRNNRLDWTSTIG